MHVAVLGGGVVGVATAYFLAEEGCDVTLIERAPQVASATSFANGAQLSYSYTDALARPDFILKIPALLLGLDPAIRVRLFNSRRLFSWGLQFLAQCTSRRERENTVAVLELALRSAALLDALRKRVAIEFSYRRAGKLVVLPEGADLEVAQARAGLKRAHGCDTAVIGYNEARTLEPALSEMRQSFGAALYSANDEVGDANAFSRGLAAWLQAKRRVNFRLGESAIGLLAVHGAVKAVQTDKESMDVDAAVVCLGPWSDDLLRPLGIGIPIYPVRGYSVTLPAGAAAPSVSITNLQHRIVFSRVQAGVRIAGFADFVGYSGAADAARVQTLIKTAAEIAPRVADYGAAETHPWAGMRPVTPDSRPRVGATNIKGLYLNVGHGVLGWTLACATGHDVARAVAGRRS